MLKKTCLAARIWKGVINPDREKPKIAESLESRESSRRTARLQEKEIEAAGTPKLRRVRKS